MNAGRLSTPLIFGYRKCMRPPVLFLLSLLLATPAAAAATAWQELEPGTRVRLIASGVLRPDGTTLAGLELDMPETTKTYWRVPGESGIPAEFELAGSDGVSSHRVLWPYPQIDVVAGFTDFVYYGPTVLPLELAVSSDDPLLRVAVTLGVCSDICMPVVAEFELPLDFAAPDLGQDLRIAQAVALTPIVWTESHQPFGDVHFDEVAGALVVPLDDPQIDPLSLIADAGPVDPLFGAPQKSPDGKLVRLPLLGDEGEGSLVGRTVRLTFMTPMGPYEVARRVAPSTAAGL